MADEPSGNFFTEKIGPLPVYLWLAIGAGAAIIISMLRKKAAPVTQSSTLNTLGVSSAQIPQFVNQTYTTVQPPEQTIPVNVNVAGNPTTPSGAPSDTSTLMSSGGYKLVMQNDGNVVEYGPNGAAMWASRYGVLTPTAPTPAGAPAAAAPAAAPVSAPAAAKTYTVQRGDNLSAIGARFGVPWQTIYNLNRTTIGSNPNLIYAGQRLTI